MHVRSGVASSQNGFDTLMESSAREAIASASSAMPSDLSGASAHGPHGPRAPRRPSVFGRIFGGYAELLRIPHTARYAFGNVIGSMPAPMIGMTVTISVQNLYGSYTLAGALSATQAISMAILQPLFGQLIDRFGQKKVAVPVMGIWMAGVISMIVALTLHAPSALLFLIMPLLACVPPWGAMCRARWAYVLAGDSRRTDRALALCGVLDECMWVIGNPLASILAVWSYLVAFCFTIGCVLVGSIMFLGAVQTEPPSEQEEAQKAGMTLREYRRMLTERAEARSKTGATGGNRNEAASKTALASARAARTASRHRPRPLLLTPAMIALETTWFGLGAFESAASISIVAMAKEQQAQNMTGFVFACFSLSSLIGVTLYGAHQWQSVLWKRFYFCLSILVLGLGSFVLTNRLWQVMLIYLMVGVCQGPTWVNGNQIIIRVVPRNQFTETTALLGAMNAVGSSIGSAIGGRLIDLSGSHGGFACVSLLGIVMLLISLCGLKQIRRATSSPIVSEVQVSARDAAA